MKNKIKQIASRLNKKPLLAVVSLVAVVGLVTLLSTNAATFSISLEPEAGTASSQIKPVSDATASGGAAVEFGGGVANTGTRGPNGTHWPSHTPAYTTPATKYINNLSELNAALASASSGDVIEVKPHTYTDTAPSGTYGLTVENGNKAWAKNVLVRPPLGQTQSVIVKGNIYINSPHITLAGLKIVSGDNGGAMGLLPTADRSVWARTVASDSIWLATYSYNKFNCRVDCTDHLEDAAWYEVVAPEPKVDGDRAGIQVGDGDIKNFSIVGSWIAGSYTAAGSSYHSDTLQIIKANVGGYGNGLLRDFNLIDSVLMPSSNAVIIAGGVWEGSFNVTNSWLSVYCSSNGDVYTTIPPGTECAGSGGIILGPDTYNATSPKLNINNSEVFGGLRINGTSPIIGSNNKIGSLTTITSHYPAPSTYERPPVSYIQGTNNTMSWDQPFSKPVLPNLNSVWNSEQ